MGLFCLSCWMPYVLPNRTNLSLSLIGTIFQRCTYCCLEACRESYFLPSSSNLFLSHKNNRCWLIPQTRFANPAGGLRLFPLGLMFLIVNLVFFPLWFLSISLISSPVIFFPIALFNLKSFKLCFFLHLETFQKNIFYSLI